MLVQLVPGASFILALVTGEGNIVMLESFVILQIPFGCGLILTLVTVVSDKQMSRLF